MFDNKIQTLIDKCPITSDLSDHVEDDLKQGMNFLTNKVLHPIFHIIEEAFAKYSKLASGAFESLTPILIESFSLPANFVSSVNGMLDKLDQDIDKLISDVFATLISAFTGIYDPASLAGNMLKSIKSIGDDTMNAAEDFINLIQEVLDLPELLT